MAASIFSCICVKPRLYTENVVNKIFYSLIL